jgi:hypothetical protein
MSSPPELFAELHKSPSEVSSSPPPQPMSTTGSRKLKKPPPITPKRFTRFFTPRNTKSGSSRASAIGSSGRQLQELTRSAINRCNNVTRRTTPRKTVNFADEMIETHAETPQMSSRKRKTLYLSPESSPAQSSPSKRSRYVTPPPFTIHEDDQPALEELQEYHVPVRRLKTLGNSSRILQRSFGGSLAIGRGFGRDHCTSWQDQTANFYSESDDLHQLARGAPPFCTASCNSKFCPVLCYQLTSSRSIP